MLITGNEASDADSIVSAIAYGFLRHCRNPGDLLVVPVVQCAREDIVLRRETELLLSLCGVDCGDLVYLSDPGVHLLLGRVQQVILVDHNKATGPIAEILGHHVGHNKATGPAGSHLLLGARVVEILDHHQDKGVHEAVSGDARRIAFDSGRATADSCCSLVTEAYLSHELGRELLARDDGAVARALLGVICIDTANLDSVKACPRDFSAVAENKKLAPMPSQDDLFAQLDAAKFDADLWAGLSVQQCFRYDYKAFSEESWSYGLSAVLCSLEALSTKAEWINETSRRAREVDLFGVLTQVKPESGGAVRRQLMLFSSDEALASAAAAFALAYLSPSLELEPIAFDGPTGLLECWRRFSRLGGRSSQSWQGSPIPHPRATTAGRATTRIVRRHGAAK